MSNHESNHRLMGGERSERKGNYSKFSNSSNARCIGKVNTITMKMDEVSDSYPR